MQRAPVYAAIALFMTLVALAATHLVGRLPMVIANKVDVARFPRAVGAWRAREDQRIDPEVQKTLATASILDRSYTDPDGRAVNLTLVSAAKGDDVHNPLVCFPGQGWQLSEQRPLRICGVDATLMTASRNDSHLCVIYWIVNARPDERREGPWLSRVRAVRSRFRSTEEGRSLLVRIIADGDAKNNTTAMAFVRAVEAPLRAVSEEAARAAPTAE